MMPRGEGSLEAGVSGARVEWETNDTEDNEIQFVSAGVQLYF